MFSFHGSHFKMMSSDYICIMFLYIFGFQVSCLSFFMDFLYSCICHPTLEELILENTKVLELNEWKQSGLALVTCTSYCDFIAAVLIAGQTQLSIAVWLRSLLHCMFVYSLSHSAMTFLSN